MIVVNVLCSVVDDLLVVMVGKMLFVLCEIL